MIIWGHRSQETVLSSGTFHCPKCDETRYYKHVRIDRYFTLFFIPLFPIRTLGEFIECQFCYRTYQPKVLDYKPPSPAERLIYTVRKELEAGIPIHMIQQKLIASRANQEIAKKVIDIATGGIQVKCPKCGFSYLSNIRLCTNCRNNLPPS